MNYKFKNIFPFVKFEVDKTYLVLFNVDKIPPHLGIIKNKKYYSITIKEKEIGLNEKAIINLIARKKIPTIIIAINDRLNNIEAYYSKYSNLEKESISCLKPIKEYFADQNEFKSDEVKVVFDLLDNLKGSIGNIYHLNLNNVIDDDASYSIFRYGLEELENHLNTLRNKNKLNV